MTHVGTDVGAASALDFAFLTYFFSGLMGFYHGARICEVEGLRVEDFGQLVLGSATALAAMVAADATSIQAENYAASDATLEICGARSTGAASDRGLLQSRARGRPRPRGSAALVKLLRGSVTS